MNLSGLRSWLSGNSAAFKLAGIEAFFWIAATGASYQSVYLKSLGLSATIIGFITALSSAVAIIASPLWGILCDKFRDTRRVTVFCILCSCVLWALIPFTSTWYLGPVSALLLTLPLINFFRTPSNTLMESFVLGACSQHRVPYPHARMAGSLGYALMCFFLVSWLPKVGYRTIFYYYGILMIPAMILIWNTKPKDPSRAAAKPLTLREMQIGSLMKNKSFVFFMIFMFFSSLPMITSFTYIPYLLDAIGSDSSLMGLIIGTRALVEIPSLLGAQWLCRRFSVQKALVASAVLLATEHLLYGAANGLPMVIALSVVHGIATGLRIALVMYYVRSLAPPHLQATAQTVNSTTGNMASITGNVIAGWLITQLGIRGFFALMGGLLTAGLLFWILSMRFTPKVEVRYD